MYGMVNKAVEQLICKDHGTAAWEKIKARAGVEIDVFMSNDPYDDAVTYRLVGTASEVLQKPAGEILHALGEHWVLFTAREDYGDLLKLHGDTLYEFLVNLPDFHSRVQMIFPNLKPPVFSVENIRPSSIDVHYRTHRQGLAQFVVGLLCGLGKYFDTPVTVKQTADRNTGADHDVFHVSWK